MGGCAWDALWNHSLKGKFIAPIMWFVTRREVKRAPYVHYVTKQFLQKRYPSNGVTASFSNVALRKINDDLLIRRLEKIKNEKEQIVVGTLGAVNVRYKGQQYVIKALQKLKKLGYTNFRYSIVGGGNPAFLKSIAAKYNVTEQVELLGPMSHEKVFDWLESIDVYCQPSRTEGLPRSLVEAMSYALPACGAKSGGIPELLDDEFLFSNSRTEVDEIVALLQKMQLSQILEGQAIRNFNEAKKFDKDTLDVCRREFIERLKGDMQHESAHKNPPHI
jgi:glycosyltransferase involved in cell wall biosynthesis